MADRLRSLQMDMVDLKFAPKLEAHEIICPVIGKINAYIQGTRAPNEVVILTVHDLGCDHTMYLEFVEHPKMAAIRNRTVWVHVDLPGQGADVPDLPTDYQFPSMQQIGEDLIHVLDQLKLKEVICFGEGAGANLLTRFAMTHIHRVLGICLMHATGTAAGLLDSLKDKVMSWKLDTIGMNPSAENYLVLHRFGATKYRWHRAVTLQSLRAGGWQRRFTFPCATFSKASDKEELKTIVESYQEALRNKANAKNLKKFVEAFLKRTNIAENIGKLKCPVLLVTGQHSLFNDTTRALHQAILKTCTDKTKVEFIEVGGVANVLEEKPDKLVECFQYFLQGLGLVSSVPMQNVVRPQRGRSMSMQEYDLPLRQRMNSAQLSYSPPVSCSPPSADGRRSGSGGGSSPESSSSPTIPDKGFAQQPLMQSN